MDKSKILGLRTTIYKVGNIENTKKWYANVFKTEPYFDQPFYVGFNIGGYELGLQPEETPPTNKMKAIVNFRKNLIFGCSFFCNSNRFLCY